MLKSNLEGCYASVLEDNRVNGSLYTRPDVFEDELDKIFGNLWVFVGHESEIPNRGSYIRRTMGLTPVVAVRAHDGAVNVFVNRCPHRGNMLCTHNAGSTRAMVCNFHGWAFDLDGNLTNVPDPKGFVGDKKDYGLHRAAVSVYRGFIFATFNPDPRPLEEQLGNTLCMIDRAVEMSPTGTIKLTGGWVKHRLKANWKLVFEQSSDGAHAPWVHASFFRAVTSHYDEIANQDEDSLALESRDLGNGHMEHDFTANYHTPLQWFGTTEAKFPDYVRAMREAYGSKAEEKLIQGPSHVTIFPNLFLAEMNIVMFQPISPKETIQWHTPILLEGVGSEINQRTLRQTEAALGPTAIVVTDDTVMMERAQAGISREASDFDLSRGVNRERMGNNGIVTGHFTDEVNNRGFWKHYKQVMLQQ